MKKLKTIMSLTLAMLLIALSVMPVLALDIQEKYNEKLKSVLATSEPDDVLHVHIKFNAGLKSVGDISLENYSEDSFAAAFREVMDYNKAQHNKILVRFVSDFPDVKINSSSCMIGEVFADMPVQNIDKIAEKDYVTNISYSDRVIFTDELALDILPDKYAVKYAHIKDGETEPDYYLYREKEYFDLCCELTVIVGNYVFFNFYGDTLSYHVYLPKSDRHITLSQAYLEDIDGIKETFSYLNSDYVGLIGDADGDSDMTIMDATFIQKCTAKLEQFRYSDKIIGTVDSEIYRQDYYYSDFNCDGARDILDATAIQKALANID